MNVDGCSAQPCPPEEELSKLRVGVMSFAGFVFVVAWIALAARPVLPEWDYLIARLMQGVISGLSGFICIDDAQGDVGEGAGEVLGMVSTVVASGSWLLSKIGSAHAFWKRNQGGQFLKIIVTYIQVLGSFTVFTVEWPSIFFEMLAKLKVIAKIDIIQLNGLSCLFVGVDFVQQLMTYTVGPLIFLASLALPLPMAWLRGYTRNSGRHGCLGRFSEAENSFRWRQTLDKFWANTMVSFCRMTLHTDKRNACNLSLQEATIRILYFTLAMCGSAKIVQLE